MKNEKKKSTVQNTVLVNATFYEIKEENKNPRSLLARRLTQRQSSERSHSGIRAGRLPVASLGFLAAPKATSWGGRLLQRGGGAVLVPERHIQPPTVCRGPQESMVSSWPGGRGQQRTEVAGLGRSVPTASEATQKNVRVR